MLTSPDDGLIVPTNATIRSGQKLRVMANTIPVAAISRHAPNRSLRPGNRCANSPMAKVRSAEPSNVLVTMAPTPNAL